MSPPPCAVGPSLPTPHHPPTAGTLAHLYTHTLSTVAHRMVLPSTPALVPALSPCSTPCWGQCWATGGCCKAAATRCGTWTTFRRSSHSSAPTCCLNCPRRSTCTLHAAGQVQGQVRSRRRLWHQLQRGPQHPFLLWPALALWWPLPSQTLGHLEPCLLPTRLWPARINRTH